MKVYLEFKFQSCAVLYNDKRFRLSRPSNAEANQFPRSKFA